MSKTPVSHSKTDDVPATASKQKPKDEKSSEGSVSEHHVPGADGPTGAEAEEDNNP
ncbi:MAG: hypothetical protein JWR39_2229 [Devosia sp.]|jgi:hypothetical protein|nr:hypothetical protein [Devosia sp.]